LMAFSMLAIDFNFHSTFEFYKSDHYAHSDRISTFEDLGPNEMASFATQGTMMLFGILLVYKHRWARYFIGLVILANSYVILYSYSRGSYFAVSVAVILLGLIKERRILIAVALFGFLWSAVLPSSVVERITMTQQGAGELDHASQVRVDVWNFGIDNFIQNPLGIGFAKFRDLGFGSSENNGRAYDAHNMYVKILTELGVQGLFVFIALYFLSLKSGWNLFKFSSDPFLSGLGLGFVGCVIGNMICNCFGQDWMLFPITSYYWIFWALVERATILVKSGRRASHEKISHRLLGGLIHQESNAPGFMFH